MKQFRLDRFLLLLLSVVMDGTHGQQEPVKKTKHVRSIGYRPLTLGSSDDNSDDVLALVSEPATMNTTTVTRTCALPSLFSPNAMYDATSAGGAAGGGSSSCTAPETQDLWNVEAAAFRMFTTVAPRIFQNRTACLSGEVKAGGIPWKYWNWVASVLSVLDVIHELQLLPARCLARHAPLRDLLLFGRDRADLLSYEYAIGYDEDPEDYPPETKRYEWWTTEFLPTTAAAFSCGFVDADNDADPNHLPHDIREEFRTRLTVRQTWRLVKGYLRSPQKQRELWTGQQDFDVSLYVPFIGVPLDQVNLGLVPYPDGTDPKQGFRTGVPPYQGPAIWWLLHTMGARFYEIENSCSPSITDEGSQKILTTFKNLLAYFGLTGPCPYCRYHFMGRVSRNDMNWTSLNVEGGNELSATYPNGTVALASESGLYPLEYLFVGGPAGSTLEKKMEAIQNSESLLLYLWKLHNAVSSSVGYSLECKRVELTDQPPWSCQSPPRNRFGLQPELQPTGYSTTGYMATDSVTTRNLGRAWPTARRFEFWLEGGAATFEDARTELVSAHIALRDLDWKYGSAIREHYWSSDSDSYLENKDGANEVMEAIVTLDKAMLKSDLLFSEYQLSTAPHCDRLDESLAVFEPLALPMPLIDGNYPWFPDACFESNE